MKVHKQPIVTMISRPQILHEEITDILNRYAPDTEWATGSYDSNGEMLAEFMGRLCYGSFGERQGRVGALAYLGNVMEQGHGSVLEHANWSFVVEGASRGFTHQMVRHRAGFAFSQESTHFIRYAEEGEEGSAEAEISVCGIPESARDVFVEQCAFAVKAYEEVWRLCRAELGDSGRKAKLKKIASGSARGLLPTALCARLGFTANARALRHFCQLRGAPDNTLEIRLVAAAVATLLKGDSPSLFADFAIVEHDDGYPRVESKWRKV